MQSLRSMQQARTSLLVNAAHPHSQLLATQAALLQNSTHPASVLLNGSLQKTLQVSYFFSILTKAIWNAFEISFILTTVWKIAKLMYLLNYETDYKGKDRVIDPNLGFPSSRDKHLLYDLGHKNKKRSLHKN